MKFKSQERLLENSVNIHEVLRSQTAAKAVSVTTGAGLALVKRKFKMMLFRIERIRNSDIQYIARLMKDHEKWLLLNSSFDYPGRRVYSRIILNGYGNVSIEVKRNLMLTLLSVHRNFRSTWRPSVERISRKYDNSIVDSTLDTYSAGWFDIFQTPQLMLPVHPDTFVKYTGVHKLGIAYQRGEHSPYAKSPIVDSNRRAGGLEFPIQVIQKARSNGKAISSHVKDMLAIMDNPSLFEAIQRVSVHWKRKLIFPDVSPEYADKLRSAKKLVESRLHVVESPSAKPRVIAIYDCHSQMALQPFHKMLEELVRSIPTDFTFDQQAGIKYLTSLAQDGIWFSSTDITAATDTIPVHLVRRILNVIIKPHVVDNTSQFIDDILTILVDRSFYFRGVPYKYGTGQPMGAYGSFPLLALCNHVLVQLAAHTVFTAHQPKYSKRKFRFFRKYAVVGDDVVIAGKAVAREYEKLLMLLNIPVNKEKSLYGYGTFEFCKRIFRDGRLQGVPTLKGVGLAVMQGDPALFYELCSNYNLDFPYSVYSDLFGRKRCRAFLRMSEDVHIRGEPDLTRIPIDVILHANRSREIERSLKNPPELITPVNAYPEDLVTGSDGQVRLSPWIERLNYGYTIYKIFKDCRERKFACGPKYPKLKKGAKLLSDKPSAWEIALNSKANVFYLSYIRTYRNKERYFRRVFGSKPMTNRMALSHYIMTRSYLWNTETKRNLYKIDPFNSRSKKLEIAVEDSFLEESLGIRFVR